MTNYNDPQEWEISGFEDDGEARAFNKIQVRMAVRAAYMAGVLRERGRGGMQVATDMAVSNIAQNLWDKGFRL